MDLQSKEKQLINSINQQIPKLQFCLKSKNGIQTYWGPEEIKKDDNNKSSIATFFEYSKDGSKLCFIEPENILIIESETGNILQKINHPKVYIAKFSPLNSFLLTWQRITEEITQDNLIIWNINNGESIKKFTIKTFHIELWPYIQWSDDELIAAKLISTEIQFFHGKKMEDIINRLKLPSISKFLFSPLTDKSNSLKVAVFVKENKGSPGFVRIYSYPQLELICSKSFYKAQDADLFWNHDGTALLILTKTEIDKSGKSYYGQTGLHFLQSDGKFESNIILKKEGPIHDIAWNPKGNEFAVTYGFMPSQTTIFDLKCQPIADLGSNSRNTLKWSPNGKILCIGGFGNLQGYMDFWDPKKLKKIGSCQANCASYIEWSPNSRFLISAILSPRMRVDNGFKIWLYDGSLIYEESLNELYEIKWRPIPSHMYPDRPPSPRVYNSVKILEQNNKKNVYIHPNATSTNLSLKKEQDGPRKYKSDQQKELPPGFVVESKSSKKNKKRRQKKKDQNISITEENEK